MSKLIRLFVFFSVAVLVGIVYATTFRPTTLSNLINTSTHIIRGEVINIEPYWRTAERNDIYTRVTLRIDENFKGDLTDEVIVTLRGGKIGDFGVEIDYMPQFETGNKGVFFLIKHREKYWIHSIGLGYYEQVTDTQTGKINVYNPIGTDIVANDLSLNKIADSGLIQKYEFDEFVETVKGFIKKSETK